ncbi:acyltransferase [Haladaptatus sp. GCM10025707]|uniref:acyltransferase n=1 Tax=unclassified Haladaptatus TaxID=2622732 RepID=UPI0023E8F7F5|nr:acyltransferase [Haladaptatus sp. QDMS2]
MRKRLHSIDTLRALAIFFITLAHLQPFRDFATHGNLLFFALDTIGQFDVPFFFVTSGYFLAAKVNTHSVTATIKGTGQKLGSIFVFGKLVSVATAALVAVIAGTSVMSQLTHSLFNLSPLSLLYYGNAQTVPLWFLPALFFSIAFVSVFVKFDNTRYLLPVAALFHVVGIVAMNFEMLIEIPFPTRDALFFGFFYVALGYTIRSSDWNPDENRSHLYLGAVVLLLGVQLAEQYAIGYLIHDNVLAQTVYTTEYTISTIFLVLALFAYALSNPGWGKNTILPKVGRHALGIYLLHVPVFFLIHATKRYWIPVIGFDLPSTLVWQVTITPFVYVLSLGSYLLMARIGVIELEGSHIPWLGQLRARGWIPARE